MIADQTASHAERIVRRSHPFFSRDSVRFSMLTRLLARVLPDAAGLMKESAGELRRECGRQAVYEAFVERLARALAEMAIGEEERRALVAEIRRDMNEFLLVYADVIATCLEPLVGLGAIDIVSVGCGAGWKEQILSGRVARRLNESSEGKAIAVSWIGLDKRDPDSEPLVDMFRAEHNYFWVDACEAESYIRAARAGSCPIIIASYLVHHLPLSPDEFLGRCSGAKAVILLEELVDEEEAADPELALARIAYELLANHAFFPPIVDKILGAPTRFWLRYWTDAEVARLRGRSICIPQVSPRTSIVVFDGQG